MSKLVCAGYELCHDSMLAHVHAHSCMRSCNLVSRFLSGAYFGVDVNLALLAVCLFSCSLSSVAVCGVHVIVLGLQCCFLCLCLGCSRTQ